MALIKRPVVLFVAAALAFAALYVSSAMARAGRIAAPLDDAYIHYQYGKQLASGAPFIYSPGGEYASGSTAPLWSSLMGLGWLVGFRGDLIVLWSVLLGALFLGLAAAAARRAVLAFTGSPAAGWLSGGLLLCNGPLLWGAFSGMEVGLYAFTIALAAEMAARRGLGSWSNVGAATLAAAARPEGTVVALGMALCDAWRRIREGGLRAAPGALRWAVPGAVGLLPAALNKLLTGSATSSSMMAKFNPRFTQPEEYDAATFLFEVVRQAFGGEFAAPLGMLLWVAFAGGAATLLVQTERRAAAVAWMVGGLFLPLVVYGAVFPLRWHHDRYVMPYLATYLPVAAAGIVAAEEWGARAVARHPLRALSAAALGLSLLSALRWGTIYGLDASDIGQQQVVVGHWLGEAVPEGQPIAVNDCGAIAYASGRPVLDLEGIVSPGVLRWAHQGEGSVFEMLEQRGRDAVPEVFALFPNWFPTLTQSPFLEERGRVTLETVHISGGASKVVYVARRELLGSGEAPRTLPAGTVVVDAVDTSDPDSEAAHGWESPDPALDLRRKNNVLWGKYAGDNAPIVDGGRRVSSESFTLAPRSPGPAWLVVRYAPGDRVPLTVTVNGRPAGTLSPTGDPENFRDAALALPELSGPARITLASVAAGPIAPRRWSSHAWLAQAAP